MLSTLKLLGPALVSVLLLVGCDVPSEPELRTDVEPAFARSGGGPVANGSGIQLRDVGNRAFAFTANRMPDGSAGGQIQLTIRGDVRIHMDVTCATSDGNRAFIGGVVTKSSVWEEGWKTGVAVEDNGQGRRAPADRVSFVVARPGDDIFDQRVCDREVDLTPNFFDVRGDVTVH